MRLGRIISVVVVTTCLGGGVARAEQLRYMDTSGNIHFVDTLAEVPKKYRDQVIPPTPAPVLDKRAIREMKQRQMEEERLRRKEEREKKMEQMRRQQAAEKEARREKKRLEEQQRNQEFSRGGS